MSAEYRDEKHSLNARIQLLEEELAARGAELLELRRRCSDEDSVLARLEGALDQRTARTRSSRRWLVAGAAALAGGIALGGGGMLLARSSMVSRAHAAGRVAPVALVSEPEAAGVEAAGVDPHVTAPRGDPCATLGVHLSVDGDDAEAKASGARDLAGQKYRRDGSRSTWFTVQSGNVYVHGVGDTMQGDVGTTKLSLLTLVTKGETGGYTLARGGRSMVEVMSADGKRITGRFEADMSKVADTTREPPFGTPIVRVRGTFCLPALPANPRDTGP